MFSNVPTCNYDPFGRLVDPCGTAVNRLTFDGDNVVRTGEDQGEWDWSFVHGPGLDDPLMGHKKLDASGEHAYYYFITDGAGRQLAVAEADGKDAANPHVDDPDSTTGGSRAMPYMAGAQFAGGIHSSFGFTAERHPSDDLPGLAFFRNRWYDQATLRWLAEDPIGRAGGLNLYQYAGNNPASFTDPFGLCKPWPECMFHAMANAGAQRGDFLGSVQLNVAAGLSGLSEAAGANDLGAAIGSGDASGAVLAEAGLLPACRAARGLKILEKFLDGSGDVRAIGSFVEQSTRKGNRGGASIQTILEHESGAQVTVHTVVDKTGKAINGPHIRLDGYKIRPGDID